MGSADDAEEVGWVFTTGEGNFFSVLDPAVVLARGLPSEAIVGQLLGRPEVRAAALRPDEIQVNRRFVDFLHRVVARHAPSLSDFRSAARQHRDGWLYIIDARTPTPQGKVPPQDILGAFEVQEGRLVEDSYQPSPAYQVVSERGLFRLHPDLWVCLLLELEQLSVE
jgi:hypothetical protein